ncbi:MAG: beta-N-acetylhexosaminidase [Rhodospirillaceae bacterium]|nr:beta-N-acetylhexosaminidase [Rhodospirillaceae bacterium]
MSETNNSWSDSLATVFGCSGHSLSADERSFFRETKPFGFILFARNIDSPDQVRALVDDVRSCVGWSAPVLIDQEGGRVQRLRPPHWRSAPPMNQFGLLYAKHPERAVEAVRINMQAIGKELADLGIDVDCAPVLDVPVPGSHDVIGDRALASDPETVRSLAVAACEGLMDAGIVPVIKHLPGHGRAAVDSHKELPVVDTPEAGLAGQDLLPFQKVAALPVAGMTAHVVYTTFDPDQPATLSRKVIAHVIRDRIGFSGLLFSDDLGMKALESSFSDRASKCLSAGCDIALHCCGDLIEMQQVADGSSRLSDSAIVSFERLESYRGKPRIDVDGTAIAFQVASLLEAAA